MKIITKTLAAAAATGALLLSGVAAAQAASVSREGGTWNYGVTGKYTYSDYQHNSREHKATACGMGCEYTGWKPPRVLASAQAISAIGGNTAYYDVK